MGRFSDRVITNRANRSSDSQMQTLIPRQRRLESRHRDGIASIMVDKNPPIDRFTATTSHAREPRGARQMPSFSLRSAFTACGFALPPDAFMT